MKFQEIEEAAFNKLPYWAKGIFHDIYQRCQPFLQQIDNQPKKNAMYRGLKHLELTGNEHHDQLGIKDVRLDGRNPTDTPMDSHAELNKYFSETYGHPYRNGLFVTGNEGTAAGYGRIYAIFPIGKFDFIWHPSIKDLWADAIDNAEAEDFMAKESGRTIGDYMKYLDKNMGQYKQDELIKGIHTYRTEIMIWVEQYYYLHLSYLPALKDFISK